MKTPGEVRYYQSPPYRSSLLLRYTHKVKVEITYAAYISHHSSVHLLGTGQGCSHSSHYWHAVGMPSAGRINLSCQAGKGITVGRLCLAVQWRSRCRHESRERLTPR